jgi:hypothetical protein
VQDRRFWVVHWLTIPSLFAAGAGAVLGGPARGGAAGLEILNNRW